MTFAKIVKNPYQSKKLFGRKLIIGMIIIALLATLAMGICLFSISSLGLGIGNNDKYLPPNCYSINGNQICPHHKS